MSELHFFGGGLFDLKVEPLQVSISFPYIMHGTQHTLACVCVCVAVAVVVLAM